MISQAKADLQDGTSLTLEDLRNKVIIKCQGNDLDLFYPAEDQKNQKKEKNGRKHKGSAKEKDEVLKTNPLLESIIYLTKTKSLEPSQPANLMQSLKEAKFEKYYSKKKKELTAFLKHHFIRIYPNNLRLTSSNFNQAKAWDLGVQMACLNTQSKDLPMAINLAMFKQNRSTGYVLRAPVEPKPKERPRGLSGLFNWGKGKIRYTRLQIELLSGQDLTGFEHKEFYIGVRVDGAPKDKEGNKKVNFEPLISNQYHPIFFDFLKKREKEGRVEDKKMELSKIAKNKEISMSFFTLKNSIPNLYSKIGILEFFEIFIF